MARALTQTQIWTICEMLNEKFNVRAQPIIRKECDESAQNRKDAIRKILGSVPDNYREAFTNILFQQYHDVTPDVPAIIGTYVHPINVQFREKLAAFKFNLIMSTAEGYQTRIDNFENSIKNLFPK